MLLSIFPKAKSLPKSKEEKEIESRFASRPHLPEKVEVNTSDDLINIVTSFVWSPSIFKNARLKEEFVSTDFLVLDVDHGLTIEEAEKRVEESGLTCLAVPTTSHKKEHHRFRLIFPLVRTITNMEDYIASMEDLITNGFPECDIAVAHNCAAFYFGSTLDDGFFIEGELLEPIKAPKPVKQAFTRPSSKSIIKVTEDLKETIRQLYGEDREFIPEAISNFLLNAHTGLPGSWTTSLNSFVFVLSLQGIEYDVVYDLVEQLAPESLTKRDIDTINYAYRDGIKHREG